MADSKKSGISRSEYVKLRSQGYTRDQIMNSGTGSSGGSGQQGGGSPSKPLTRKDFVKLRSKGYTSDEIKKMYEPRTPWVTEETAGDSFNSWGNLADKYQDWAEKQSDNIADWDDTQASYWVRLLQENAQQARQRLEELTAAGKKKGDEEFDAYKGYFDYFSSVANGLSQNNNAFYTYRDENMYKGQNGRYYSYDDVLKMEEELKEETSGLNFRITSGYGTGSAGLPNFGVEIIDPNRRDKKKQLTDVRNWLADQKVLREQNEANADELVWVTQNLGNGQDTETVFRNYDSIYQQASQEYDDWYDSAPIYENYRYVDENGNYDYDNDTYLADKEAWEIKRDELLRKKNEAEKQRGYANKYRDMSLINLANSGADDVASVIEKGKLAYEGILEDEDERYGYLDAPGTKAFAGEFGFAYETAGRKGSERSRADTSDWSEDKLNAYYYLLGSGKDADAERLAKLTNDAISAQKNYEEIYKPLEDWQKAHPGWGGVAAFGAGVIVPLVTGIPEFIMTATEYAATGDIDPTSVTPIKVSNKMVGTTANQLNSWSGTIDDGVSVLGGKGVGDAYQIAISIAQSAVSIATGNVLAGAVGLTGEAAAKAAEYVTLTQFFGSAASSGIYDGLEKGLDPGKALMLGTMNGIAEVLGEKLSVENLVHIGNSQMARKLVKDVFVQAGIEASEEAFTTLLNTMADMIVNGDKNDLQLEINALVSHGMSYEQAKKEAIKNWLNGMAQDALGGFISGGFSAGVQTIRANTGTYRGSTEYLMDLAQQTAEGSKSREMLPDIMDEYTRKSGRKQTWLENKLGIDRRNISARHGNVFAAQVKQDLISNNKATAVRAIENRLAELGETGNIHQKAERMADVLIADMSGEDAKVKGLMPSAQFSANATANMRDVMNELIQARESFSAADYARENSDWKDEIMKGRFLDANVLAGDYRSVMDYQYGRAVENRLNEHMTQITDLEQQISEAKKELGRTSPTDTAKRRQLNEEIRTAENALKSHRNAILEDGYNSYSEDQKSATVKINGTEYKVSGLTMENGGDAQIKLSGADGVTQSVSIDDERLPAAVRSLALKTKSLGWAASAAFQYYKPGTDVSAYINRIQNIMAFASENISYDAFMNSKVVKALGSEALAEFLYSHGQDIRKTAQAEISKKISETKEAIKKAQKEAKGKTGRKGKVDTTSGMDIGNKHYDGIEGMELSETQQAVVRMIENLSDSLNINYILFNGDARGVLGVYRKGGTIAVNINAGSYSNGKLVRSLAAETLSHELTHFIEQFAEEEYQALRDAVVEVAFGKDSERFEKAVLKALRNLPANFIADHQKEIQSYVDHGMSRAEAEDALRNDYAMREVVADACTVMLKNSKTVTELARQNMTAAQKVADFIEQTVQKIRNAITAAFADSDPKFYRQEAKLILDEAERIQKLWDAGLKAAKENYNALQEGGAASEQYQTSEEQRRSTEVGTYNLSEFSEAKSTDGQDLFQVAAFEHDEPEYRTMLEKTGMKTEEIDDLFETIDNAMDIIKGNLEALDYAWDADIDDRGFSPVKPNSDKLYKVSQDFSTLCRKRILQGAVANQLQAALNRALTRDEGIAIRDALMAIQAEGKQIEVACALCYVESARMRSPVQIQKFLDNKEKVLKDFFAGQDRKAMKAKIDQAELNERQKIYEENGLVKGKGQDNTMYDVRDPKAAPLKKLPGKLADQIRAAKKAAKATYTVTAEQQKIIDTANSMTVSDFTSPEGLENLAKNHREIFDAYTSFIRNATNSKGIENDTWWRAGDSGKISDLLIQQMNNENGLRTQSWSDFQVKHLMDYVAATIELSSRGAKQHAYTKVIDYVDLMGDTGVMINMSLIPTREYSGKLEYDNVEGFVAKEAKRLREKYHKTAGTICIGVEDNQIRQLLASDFIDYVIPYHNSGMAAHTRAAMHIPSWTNYQDFQGEKKLTGAAAVENAKRFGVQLLDESDPMWHESPNFSDWYNLDRARQIAKNTGKTGKFGVMTGGYVAMQDAARNYLQMCAERGLAPKFSYGRADFSGEENYWKLLIDRKMVDNVTGDIIEQEKIQPRFDFNTIERILNDELDRYGKVKADQNEATRRVTEAFLSGKIKAGMNSEAIAEIMQKPVDNISITNITGGERASAETNTIEETSPNVAESGAIDQGIQLQRAVNDEDTFELPDGTIVNTAEWLAKEEAAGRVIHTYKSFVQYEPGGPLYAPMATMTKDESGKYKRAHGLKLGQWEVSEGNLKNVNTENLKTDRVSGRQYATFDLKKTPEEGGGSVPAAYNPYQHSSNVVLNDQFEMAYKRSDLVTVECIIPAFEMSSGYWAPYAKDPVGMHQWHKGTVAKDLKNTDRQVYMTRWLKPVRILSDSEVAQKYADILEGETVKIPFSVVSPVLLTELEKIGVPIDYEGSPQYRFNRAKNIPESISSSFEEIARQRLIDEGKVNKKTGLPNKKDLEDMAKTVRDEWMLRNWGPAYIKGTSDAPGRINDDYSIKQQDQFQRYDGIEDAAKEHFGTTEDYRTAGYILQDGTMLDFSGAHWLEGYDEKYIADWRKKNDIRQVDHEDIFEAFEQMGTDFPNDSRKAFIDRGNIRFSPEAPGINISDQTKLTDAQYQRIKDFIRSTDMDHFYVDIEGKRGRLGKLEYSGKINADRVVNDIRNFYQTGEIRQSSVSQFHDQFQVASDEDYMDAVNSGNTEEQQRMVDDAARAAGYTIRAFHGSPHTGISVFDINRAGENTGVYGDRAIWFTDSEDFADSMSYQQLEGSSAFRARRGSKGKVYDTYLRINNPFVLQNMTPEMRDLLWEMNLSKLRSMGMEPGNSSMGDRDYFFRIVDEALAAGNDQYVKFYVDYSMLQDAGYDGIVARLFSNTEKDNSVEYGVFSPEQIKSADPVTYDEAGNVIPLSQRFNDDRPEIQYQMADRTADDTLFESEERTKAWTDLRAENEILRESAEHLAKEIEKLTKRNDKLGRELKRTTTPEIRLNDAKKLARQIVTMTQREAVTTRDKQYNKEMADELAERIKGVADYIVQSGESMDYDKVTEMAYEIAQDIVNNAEAEIDDGGATKELREQMKAALKGKAIYVAPNVRADTLDWNAFKKAHRDIFTFREDGTPIDMVYESLLDEVPGLLDPTINNPGDMLNEMAEKWDLLQPKYENPYEQYENEAVSHFMNMIIESALDGTLRQVAPTYADKMNSRLAALREQKREAVKAAKTEGRERLEALREEKNSRIEEVRQEGIARKQEALAKERADKWDRVEATRKYYQEMAERASIRRSNGSSRTRIKKLVADLNTRLTHPTEKRYVPAHLVKNTIDILEMIDLDSGRGGVKLAEKIALLQQQYAQLKNDKSFQGYAYDSVIEAAITKMAQVVGDTPLRNMNANQLETVLTTLQELEHVIRTSIKQRIHGENVNLYESGRNAIKSTNGVSDKSSNLLGNAADWYTSNTMRPDVVFERFGGFAKDSEWVRLFNMLNNSQRYGMDLQMKFAKPFEDLLKDKKNLAKLTSAKDADLVDIGLKDENGNAIKITRDFMLFVYMNLFNEDNIRHVMFGGITVPELKEYLAGKGDRGFGKGHRKAVGISNKLAEINDAINNATDVTEKARLLEEKNAILQEGMEYIDRLRSSIEEKLTDYDKKWVEAWRMFNEMASETLNQTTMDVYGIKKFIVENYFPIITDKNYVDVPMETIMKDMSLENAGFTKERIHASTPIKMMGLADVINMQASRTAQYAAMMPATRAFNRIWNTTLPGYSTSLRDTVNSKFGSNGVKFVENLISDLQGGRHGDFTIFDRMRGRMAQATLSLNPRVALAQTASFPTAAAELGWKPVMKALAKGGKNNQLISAAERELIAKWSSTLWFRTKGATGDLADVKNMQQASHKVMDKLGWAMNWIEFMDSATVGRLWYAAQYYVDEKNPELKKGSDAYYEKVAEAFNRCIERTQPNYTTLQRPELLRNPHATVRALTMFMTQRLQNQSILYGAVMKYNKYKSDLATGKNGVTQTDVNEMRDRLINAATSQLVAGFTIAIFKALCDGILHRWGKNYRDDDNELTAESISLEIMDMWAESLVSNVVGGSEIYTIVKSIITGDRYYGIELSGVSTFTDAIKDFVSLAQKPSLKGAKKLGQDFCMFFGIPEANAEKIGMALWNWGKDIVTGNGFMESGVERTSAQNARLLIKAYEAEDEKKIERFSGEFKDDDTRLDAVRQNIKDGYVAKKQTISKTEAVELLVKAGMRRKDAEAKVQEWTCEIVTGIPFSKIKDEFMKGNITQYRVAELLQKYGGRDKESAEKTARYYACEKDTGYVYNDLKDAYLEGEIGRSQMVSIFKKYGLMSSEEAVRKADFYDYLKLVPNSKISEQRAAVFMKDIKKTGLSAKEYENMVLHVDADDSGGYSQKEVGAYIQRHNFTEAQINALWKAFGKTWKTDFYTWEVKMAADATGTGKGQNNGNVSQAELGYYLVDEIKAGRMTMAQAEKYWKSLLTTSKKDFQQWCKSKRIKFN